MKNNIQILLIKLKKFIKINPKKLKKIFKKKYL